jgi:hypothetical protein
MSTRSLPVQSGLPLTALRVSFWTVGLLLASAQAWISRYQLSSDSISYLDMSDAVLPGSSWSRLINGVWSPLYPFLLGAFRRIFRISPNNEIAIAHLLNIVFFVFAFLCFEFLLRGVSTAFAPATVARHDEAVAMPRWTHLCSGTLESLSRAGGDSRHRLSGQSAHAPAWGSASADEYAGGFRMACGPENGGGFVGVIATDRQPVLRSALPAARLFHHG